MRDWRARAAITTSLSLILASTLAFVGGVSFADTPVPPVSPLPHTTLVFTSDPGGVGQGVHRSFDSSVDHMTADILTPANIEVNAQDQTVGGTNWTLSLHGGLGAPLTVGSYGGLNDINVGNAASMDFIGNGRSCGGGPDSGDGFTVKDIASSQGTVTRLDVVFEHHCGVPTDFGELRIGEPDAPGASIPWRTVNFPATPVGTSASTAYIPVTSTAGSATNFAYDLAGPADYPFAVSPGTCGTDLLSLATCTLAVTFTAHQVGTVTATLTIQVGSVSTPVTLTGTTGFGTTLVAFDSHPGDYVGNGSGVYLFSAANSTLRFSPGATSFTGNIYGLGGPFSFQIATATGQLEPGTYLSGSTGPNRVSLSVDGQGRGCGGAVTPTSAVVIRQVQLSPLGLVVRFDASFTQTCVGSTGALTGRIEYNATPSVQQVVAPVRVLDTRKHQGSPLGSIPANGSLTVPLSAVPALTRPDVTSATVNVVVVNARGGGYLSAGSGGSDSNPSSALNFSPGQTIANLITVPLGPSKSITLWNHSPAPEDVVADLQAISVASDSDSSGAFVPLPTTRLDLSAGSGPRTVIGGYGQLTVNLAAYPTGPATGMTAALTNLTVIGGTAGGYLTLGIPGTPRTVSSAMNFGAGTVTAALAVAPVSPTGSFTIYNGSSRPINLIIDLEGYYTAGTQTAATGSLTPRTASRSVDTRIGIGAPRGAIGPGQSITLDLQGGPPQGAFLTVTTTQATAGGYLSLNVTNSDNPSGTSVLNFTPQQNRSNLTVTALGGSGLTFTNHSLGSVQVIVDVDGIIT